MISPLVLIQGALQAIGGLLTKSIVKRFWKNPHDRIIGDYVGFDKNKNDQQLTERSEAKITKTKSGLFQIDVNTHEINEGWRGFITMKSDEIGVVPYFITKPESKKQVSGRKRFELKTKDSFELFDEKPPDFGCEYFFRVAKKKS